MQTYKVYFLLKVSKDRINIQNMMWYSVYPSWDHLSTFTSAMYSLLRNAVEQFFTLTWSPHWTFFFSFFLYSLSQFYQRDCFLSYLVISLILTGEILHLYDLRDLQNCLFPAGCRDGVRDESFHLRSFSSIHHSICSLKVELHLMSLWNDYCKSLLRLPVEQLK